MTRPIAGKAGTQPPLTPEQLQAGLGEAAEQRVAGRYDEAAWLYLQIEARNPEAVDATYFLALVDLARGRPADALPRLEALARRMPGEVKIWNALAYTRRDLGQWGAALQALDQVEALDPSATPGDRLKVLEVLGRIDEAVALYRRMAAAPVTRLAALIGLANLRSGDVGPEDRTAMIAAARSGDLDVEVQIPLQFALGEVEERLGDTDAAFAAFAAGNALKRRTLTGDLPRPAPAPIGSQVRDLDPDRAAEDHRRTVAVRKAIFTPDFIAEYEGRGHHIAAPIFIVGMPRSGSTLLEQILSSHRRVQGLGETRALSDTARGQYPIDLFAANPPEHFRNLAEAYFKAMHGHGWTSAPRFVDKMLRNYLNIGLIHLMLPRAAILHSVRDPVDTCLACYRKLFESGNETTYDLGDIGREYVRYREMMDHWTAVLPGRVVEVSHEALVADPEPRVRWLVTEACGLDWDPACLRFYETRRPVRTASVAQVRRPIFTSSIERWRRYEKHLGPLFDALGPYAPSA